MSVAKQRDTDWNLVNRQLVSLTHDRKTSGGADGAWVGHRGGGSAVGGLNISLFRATGTFDTIVTTETKRLFV